LVCNAWCITPNPFTNSSKCCPKICGPIDPFDPGSGCCDANEGCVDRSDPNARDGCCPAGRSICGGKCCADRETCCGDYCKPADVPCVSGTPCPFPNHVCGDTCCPPFNPCCRDQCCDLNQICHPVDGTCWTPPPPPPVKDPRCDAPGWSYCAEIAACCPPDKICCYGACRHPGECLH
jgi:hypothetical protein